MEIIRDKDSGSTFGLRAEQRRESVFTEIDGGEIYNALTGRHADAHLRREIGKGKMFKRIMEDDGVIHGLQKSCHNMHDVC